MWLVECSLGVMCWLSTNLSRMLGDKWIQLSPTRHQAITWTITDLSLIGAPEKVCCDVDRDKVPS